MESQTSVTPAPPLTTEERNWAMASHLSALVAIAGLPFGHVVGPLIVYLVKHKESAFVAEHSRSSLNYQITVSIAAILAIIVGIIVFAAVIAAVGVSSSHTSDDAASAAAGVSIIALWCIIFGVVGSLFIVSLVFIIMGTMAAGAGKPYTYPFAIKFVR
jgi:uncharacterized Tic20 family protein